MTIGAPHIRPSVSGNFRPVDHSVPAMKPSDPADLALALIGATAATAALVWVALTRRERALDLAAETRRLGERPLHPLMGVPAHVAREAS